MIRFGWIKVVEKIMHLLVVWVNRETTNIPLLSRASAWVIRQLMSIIGSWILRYELEMS